MRINNDESKKPLLRWLLICFTSTIPVALIFTWLSLHILEPLNTVFVIFMLSFLYKIINNSNIGNNIFYLSISYSISFIIYYFSIAIAGLIFEFVLKIDGMNVWGALLIVAIQTLFILILFKIKFKTIIKYNKNATSAGMAISGIAFILNSIIRDDRSSLSDFLLPFTGIVLCGLGMYWWSRKESVINFNDSSHEIVLSQMDARIEKLEESNLYLEKALHTREKIYPAYQEAIEGLVIETGKPELRKKVEGIIGEFISDERFYDESCELRERKRLPTTGMALLDAVFEHYNKKCILKDIDFDLMIRGDVHKIKDFIKQTDLEALVANLINNAIIACEHSSQADKSIVVNISDGGLSVMDNGIAFEPETLELLGKERVTTHADTGGSGLGFLTIFEIARSCKASIVITKTGEYKTVAVLFDGEGDYRVETEEALRV